MPKTTEEIVDRIKQRCAELKHLSTEADCPATAKEWIGARVGELRALQSFIASDDAADAGKGGNLKCD